MLEVGGHLFEGEAGLELQLACGEVIEHRVDADAGDGARERRARAHVRAVAEREVLVGVGAVDLELVGRVEDPVVAVRRRGADHDSFAPMHGTTGDLGVAHASAREEQDRGSEPQALLDRGREERAVGAQRAPRLRVG